jgi:hypothetical protein
MLDSSLSTGNIVKRTWFIDGYYYDSTLKTTITVKKQFKATLIVEDNLGRKDTSIQIIQK